MRRDQVRLLVAVVLTLALVVPLGWMWWDSRLPSSYSAMSMGEPDHGGGPRAAGHAHGGRHQEHPVSVADLDTVTDRPADVVVDLVAREGEVVLASGERVEGFTLNGSSPGPSIEATVGQLVEVRLHNESVEGGVALHWHGVDVPNAQDGVAGVTQDAVARGERHTYRWVAPDVGTYWYHSHQLSDEQVKGGLLGSIVIHPEAREAGVRDVVAVSHLYAGRATVNGRTGEVRVDADPGERLRVRVVNTDNGQQNVWSRTPFLVRAVDGVEVHEPTPVVDRSVAVPAGGRVDLEVRVPQDGAAVPVELLGGARLVIGRAGAGADPEEKPDGELDLLRYGSPRPVALATSRIDRSFRYSVGRRPGFLDGRPGMWWSVNGKLYPDMPMFVVREGDVVRVRISNGSGVSHPMHLHGHHALVLARDGQRSTGSPWWFDSLEVKDGESFDVVFRADNPGLWMDHCHNLKHAREGLVTHLMYERVTTPYRLGEDSGNVPE